jgi:hypothetical protein
MSVTTLQAIVCLAFEAYVFAKFQTSLGDYVDNDKVQSQYKTIPTFLTLFIFGFLYELVIVWDALRMKNTIQVIGVCIANLALLVYTGLQIDQIQLAIGVLGDNHALETGITSALLWSDLKAFLIAIPVVVGAVTICMAFITFKLYQEFAWDILKNIGADYRMKKRFLSYQVSYASVIAKALRIQQTDKGFLDLYCAAEIRFLLLPGLHHSVCRRRRAKIRPRVCSDDCNHSRYHCNSSCCGLLHSQREQAGDDLRHGSLPRRLVLLRIQAGSHLPTQSQTVLRRRSQVPYGIRRHHDSVDHSTHRECHHVHDELQPGTQGSSFVNKEGGREARHNVH